jgi:flagellar basal-body rod modification protein FlgD
MQVATVGPAAYAKAAETEQLGQATQLGQDFMTLLIAQLQAQDPMEPMTSSEFMAQLVQLQSLAETSEMNQALTDLLAVNSRSSALALVGRTVQWQDAGSGESGSGTVSRVELGGGADCRLTVGGREISMSEIVAVS